MKLLKFFIICKALLVLMNLNCTDETSLHTKSCFLPCSDLSTYQVVNSYNNSYYTNSLPWDGVLLRDGNVYKCQDGYGIYLFGFPLEFYAQVINSPYIYSEAKKLLPALLWILMGILVAGIW